MLERQQRDNYFSVLRQALKARGMTYAQLAGGLGISELSVKRLFRDKDCKVSRLLEICDLLEIRFDDLVQMQERSRSVPELLPEGVEKALADDITLFNIFIHIISDESLEDIEASSQLSEAELYMYLRQLEKLELIEIMSDQRVRLLIPTPIRWRLQGSLAQAIKGANQQFIGLCFNRETDEDYDFSTGSRLMTASSVQKIREQLYALNREFDRLSAQDKLFYTRDQLKSVKLVMVLGPFVAGQLFPIKNGNKAG